MRNNNISHNHHHTMTIFKEWRHVPSKTREYIESEFNIKSVEDFISAVKETNPNTTKFKRKRTSGSFVTTMQSLGCSLPTDPRVLESLETLESREEEQEPIELYFIVRQMIGRRSISFRTVSKLLRSFCPELKLHDKMDDPSIPKRAFYASPNCFTSDAWKDFIPRTNNGWRRLGITYVDMPLFKSYVNVESAEELKKEYQDKPELLERTLRHVRADSRCKIGKLTTTKIWEFVFGADTRIKANNSGMVFHIMFEVQSVLWKDLITAIPDNLDDNVLFFESGNNKMYRAKPKDLSNLSSVMLICANDKAKDERLTKFWAFVVRHFFVDEIKAPQLCFQFKRKD